MEPEERVFADEFIERLLSDYNLELSKDELEEFHSMCLTFDHGYGYIDGNTKNYYASKRHIQTLILSLFKWHVLSLMRKIKHLENKNNENVPSGIQSGI